MFYMRRDDAEQAAQLMLKGGVDGFEPSTDWAQGGPIIERMRPTFVDGVDQVVCSLSRPVEVLYASELAKRFCTMRGPTYLIAAMRCFVASRLGDEVELPDELVQS